MKAMKFTVAFPDGAAVHRVVQALRTLHSDAGIAERPEIVIVAGDGNDAEGIARQLRQLGVNITVHESLEVAAVEAFDRAALPPRPEAVLLGSDTYPAYIEINGENVQLGTLVAKAHALSGMSVSTWNSLTPEQVDDYIEAAIDAYRTQDPTAPVHDITGAEFAAAMQQKQDQAKAELAAAAASAAINAEHADVLGEQEKDDPSDEGVHNNAQMAAAMQQMDSQLSAGGEVRDTLYRGEATDTTEATQGGQDATGPAPDGSEASTTTDGSASE